MKLQDIKVLEATLVLESGLHIGSGDNEIHIGGVDNPVIKNPITQQPYIPGSSLKGKIRSLLEWRSGAVQESPLGKKEWDASSGEQKIEVERILKLFGVSATDIHDDTQKKIGHTRASFWDSSLCPEYVEMIRSKNQMFTEVKSENTINRITGTAAHPRQMERVAEGARFNFKLSIKQFDQDGDDLLETLLKGLRLLELDSLGGSGSRGYGKVKFENLTLTSQGQTSDISEKFNQLQLF